MNKEIGKKGEDEAAKYLSNNGYEILERNWRFKQDEIDIIAKKNDWLIIVEVKTRSKTLWGEPWEAVDQRKENAIVRAAEKYIEIKDLDIDLRFDIISIIYSGGDNMLINHIENAFTL